MNGQTAVVTVNQHIHVGDCYVLLFGYENHSRTLRFLFVRKKTGKIFFLDFGE